MSEWLQIDEEGEIDVEEIMRKIKAHIAQRRLMEEGGQAVTPHLQGRFAQALYDELSEAIQEKDKAYATLQVTRSPLPVVGWIVDTLRRKVHELVVFYINQGAARQIAFNDHIVRAFSALIEELEHSEGTRAEIEALQKQVEALQARVDTLETR
jgi:hypothetical protein